MYLWKNNTVKNEKSTTNLISWIWNLQLEFITKYSFIVIMHRIPSLETKYMFWH